MIQLKIDASENSGIVADLNQAFVSGCAVTVNVIVVVVVLVVALCGRLLGILWIYVKRQWM